MSEQARGARMIVMTPSVFSAGWQVDIFDERTRMQNMRGSRMSFRAREVGSLFSEKLAWQFTGLGCPVLAREEANANDMLQMMHYGVFQLPSTPPSKSPLRVQVRNEVLIHLFGGLSSDPRSHPFSFDEENDEWADLVGPRFELHGYRTLEYYRRKWDELPRVVAPRAPHLGFGFLGDAFGGTRKSQIKHMILLVWDLRHGWPDFWETKTGKAVKGELFRKIHRFQRQEDWGTVFATVNDFFKYSNAVDMIVQDYNLARPSGRRCRYWRYTEPEREDFSTVPTFTDTLRSIFVPLRHNICPYSLGHAAQYLQCALASTGPTSYDVVYSSA